MTKNKFTVIAIDRAEKHLVEACELFASKYKATINAYLLVNEAFHNSPSYHGNDGEGYFQEIICDFSNVEQMNTVLEIIGDDRPIIHCRMDKSIKDYQKIIPYFPNSLSPTTVSLTLATEKFEMRKAFSDMYPEITPKFVQLHSANDLNEHLLQDFSYPLIVKPNGLHSSLLVKKCDDYSQVKVSLEAAFLELEKLYILEYGTGAPSVIVEEFINGEMYSIDTYTYENGRTIFLPPVRVITAAEVGLDGYYSYRHILPSNLSLQEISLANECALKAIESVRLINSVAHIELYRTENGWKIIELGPRIGGYRQDLYYQAFGINHYLNDLLLHAGLEVDIRHKWNRHAAGLNIYSDKEGTITSIEGLDEAKSLKSVVYLQQHANIGDKAVYASKGGIYIIDGILSNDDSEVLERDVSLVRELIKIKTL